jgi:hypothetical protein
VDGAVWRSVRSGRWPLSASILSERPGAVPRRWPIGVRGAGAAVTGGPIAREGTLTHGQCVCGLAGGTPGIGWQARRIWASHGGSACTQEEPAQVANLGKTGPP